MFVKAAETLQVPDASGAAAQTAVAEEEADEEVETEGVKMKDIELMMSQDTMTRHRDKTHKELYEKEKTNVTTQEWMDIFMRKGIEKSCDNPERVIVLMQPQIWDYEDKIRVETKFETE